ncbi:MAG: double-strand break repair helicase AddA [Microvirga sp.]|jgi:ATP-dependent helicase/nuclease subunit A|nr:double-strand break repair helicase AddA [Microvirga sp.]
MSVEFLVVDEHTRVSQRRAADPRASAWVSANAGAGKTKVLSDRVLRLLLAGTPPARILCLTFTKAAAANMSIRVFERLGQWVTLSEAELVKELQELEGERPSPAQIRQARRLFARAVETPGGLKIETIHAFCERLLHLVPFEANVPARFVVLDESQVEELIAEATKSVLAAAATERSPKLAEAFGRISLEAAGEGLFAAVKAAVQAVKCEKLPGDVDSAVARLRAALGLGDAETSASVERAILDDGLTATQLRQIAERLETSSANSDRELGNSISSCLSALSDADRLRLYRCIFFTENGEGGPRARLCTRSAPEPVKDALAAERDRLVPLCTKLRAAQTLERTQALFTLAVAIVERVEAHKQRIGALDFDDLIARTLALLSRGDGAWVLYKLDRGIDHVLVDEAQDTNPEQWRILRHVTEDFTAGSGARQGPVRTVFAVGDPKQSIYSFQGAAPREFEENRRFWRKRSGGAALRFEEVSLNLSFRSAPAVLSAVDETFRIERHFRGLSFDDAAIGTVHKSARPQAPGLVELWPTEAPQEDDEPDAWALPVDEPERRAPPVVLAGRIAKAIRTWTRTGDEGGRVWSPGDILVLVRKRGAAFEAVIRALKTAGVPVAGADRLDIGEHIAVLDLVAAGRAALRPEDDLTLATALKSPLAGLDDRDLIRIAAGRGEAESLVDALQRHAEAGDGPARGGCETLRSWRVLAAQHGAFGFYASLLGPMHGRRKLVARLGPEAGDAIDAFLCFAQSTEMLETPSLATFLARFESASHQVKRDLDAARGEVRVMTVHGAKGLEAPIVILIDGCHVLGQDPPLIPMPVGNATMPVWSPGRKYDPPAVAAAREELRGLGKEEHNRLLYVAMTRAKDRLVIAPYRTAGKDAPEEAWCEMVRRSLANETGGLVRHDAPYGPIEVWRDDNARPALATSHRAAAAPPRLLPEWLTKAVGPEPEPAPPLRPSYVVAHAPPWRKGGSGADQARLRGTLVHALIEKLPALEAEKREAAALAYVQARAPRLSEEDRLRIVRSALGVLDHPTLAPLFGAHSRAEVAIVGRLRVDGEERPVSGQIDRLAVLDAEVLVADFKSDARVTVPGAAPPRAYAAQLAVYRALLQDVYPGRRIRAFLVWTAAGPLIQEVAGTELDETLGLVTARVTGMAALP